MFFVSCTGLPTAMIAFKIALYFSALWFARNEVRRFPVFSYDDCNGVLAGPLHSGHIQYFEWQRRWVYILEEVVKERRRWKKGIRVLDSIVLCQSGACLSWSRQTCDYKPSQVCGFRRSNLTFDVLNMVCGRLLGYGTLNILLALWCGCVSGIWGTIIERKVINPRVLAEEERRVEFLVWHSLLLMSVPICF